MSLWRAVIAESLAELAGRGVSTNEFANVAAARAFFFHFNDKFLSICAAADLDPTAVRARARRLLNKPRR